MHSTIYAYLRDSSNMHSTIYAYLRWSRTLADTIYAYLRWSRPLADTTWSVFRMLPGPPGFLYFGWLSGATLKADFSLLIFVDSALRRPRAVSGHFPGPPAGDWVGTTYAYLGRCSIMPSTIYAYLRRYSIMPSTIYA